MTAASLELRVLPVTAQGYLCMYEAPNAAGGKVLWWPPHDHPADRCDIRSFVYRREPTGPPALLAHHPGTVAS